MGAQRGRATKPDLKLGICGEHGGDPESIQILLRRGPRLRLVFAVPGTDRPAGRRTGGAQQQLIVPANLAVAAASTAGANNDSFNCLDTGSRDSDLSR